MDFWCWSSVVGTPQGVVCSLDGGRSDRTFFEVHGKLELRLESVLRVASKADRTTKIGRVISPIGVFEPIVVTALG